MPVIINQSDIKLSERILHLIHSSCSSFDQPASIRLLRLWGNQRESGSIEELISEVTGVARFILYVTLIDVCRKWERRLRECFNIDGDDVDQNVDENIFAVTPVFLKLTIRNGSRIPDISTRAPNGARGVIAC
jgi:hypothetical protein